METASQGRDVGNLLYTGVGLLYGCMAKAPGTLELSHSVGAVGDIYELPKAAEHRSHDGHDFVMIGYPPALFMQRVASERASEPSYPALHETVAFEMITHSFLIIHLISSACSSPTSASNLSILMKS